METIELQGQIDCVRRELQMRDFVYPTRIANRKMTQAKADHEMAAMRAVLATLTELQASRAAAPALSAVHAR